MAASFYSSPLIGATTTLACFAHEIPHEIADYSILIRSGFTKRQAMQSQFITAIGAFVSVVGMRSSSSEYRLTGPCFPLPLGPLDRVSSRFPRVVCFWASCANCDCVVTVD
jgi:hypothetical protein